MPRLSHDRRPDPDAFLRLAARDARPGRLKVYLGMAAGVGKTWKMLDDAHHLRRHGTDVVIGYVETHGRSETEARIGDLEVVPRKQVSYQGVVLPEMDLDAILRRKPDVVLVDELAHTNAPGRVAVAMPLDPETGRRLILRGSRVAGRMNTRWFALHVRRARERPERLSARQHRALTENVELAMTLGATVVVREAEDVAAEVLRFVKDENVGIVIVGTPSRRGLAARLLPGTVDRILARAEGFDLLVAGAIGDDDA